MRLYVVVFNVSEKETLNTDNILRKLASQSKSFDAFMCPRETKRFTQDKTNFIVLPIILSNTIEARKYYDQQNKKLNLNGLILNKDFFSLREAGLRYSRTFLLVENVLQNIRGAKITEDRTLIYRNNVYEILCRGTQGFSLKDKKIISLSSCEIPREAIVLDANSKVLNEQYIGLKKTINTQDTMEAILSQVVIFIRNRMNNKFSPMLSDIQKLSEMRNMGILHYYSYNTIRRILIVKLSEFVNARVGFCRHLSLYTCYLLDRLASDGIIKNVSVFHYRDTLKKQYEFVGHSFAVCKIAKSNQDAQLFIVDPSFNIVTNTNTTASNIVKKYSYSILGRVHDAFMKEDDMLSTQEMDSSEEEIQSTLEYISAL